MTRYTSSRSLGTVRHGWSLFKNRRTMWQMVREVVNGKYRMSLLTNVVLVLGLAYVVIPFDLIPDWIPVIGWIDDAVVIFLLIKRLNNETMRYIRYKAMERKQPDTVRV